MSKNRWFLPALCVLSGMTAVILLVKLYMPPIVYGDIRLDVVLRVSDNVSTEKFVETLTSIAQSENITVLGWKEQPYDNYDKLVGLYVDAPYDLRGSGVGTLGFRVQRLRLIRLGYIIVLFIISVLFCVLIPLGWLLDRIKETPPVFAGSTTGSRQEKD